MGAQGFEPWSTDISDHRIISVLQRIPISGVRDDSQATPCPRESKEINSLLYNFREIYLMVLFYDFHKIVVS